MGKLTYGMNVSVDGYIADTNGDIGWSDPDAELHQYWNDQVRDTAVSLYGRKRNELMPAHWPTLPAPLGRAGPVDEFHGVVPPAAVGGGTPFFPTLDKWITLELVENRTFPSGAVLLRYVAKN